MKKIVVIAIMIAMLGLSSRAQDVYTCGYYINGHGRATAAVWKNGTVLYQQSEQGDFETSAFAVTPSRDVYWTYGDKILKNENVQSSFSGKAEHMFYDESQQGLIITGYYYDCDYVPHARVWDGQGAVMYDLDLGKSEAYKTVCYYNQASVQLYTCGYMIGGDGQKSAIVWIDGGATYGGETITIDNGSAIVDLALHNGKLYLLYYETVSGTLYDTYTMKLWCDGEILHTYNNDAEGLWRLCFDGDDIVVGGQPAGGPATIWKNGEIYHTYNEAKVTAMDVGSDGVYVATLNDCKPKIWRNDTQIYSFPVYTEFYDMHVMSSDAVEDNSIANDITICPNPSTNILYIKLSHYVDCQSVEIYTLDGRIIETFQETSLQNNAIDISNLNSGVYLMKLKMADGKEFSKRIVKE